MASMQVGWLNQGGCSDILAAVRIADNERYRHQLPGEEIIDGDVAFQIRVIETLTGITLD